MCSTYGLRTTENRTIYRGRYTYNQGVCVILFIRYKQNMFFVVFRIRLFFIIIMNKTAYGWGETTKKQIIQSIH